MPFEMANAEDEDITFNIKKKLDLEFVEEDKKTSITPVTEDSPLAGGHMKVYLRIRPLSDTEKSIGEDQECVKLENENLLVTNAPRESNTYKNAAHRLGKGLSQKFTFSKIFKEDTTQKKFFDEAVLQTVKDFINGQNCLLFTYGVTNSGKTFTIQGSPGDVGILPRALDVLFNTIQDRQWSGRMVKPTRFCDVIALSPSQEEDERKIKNSILKQAEMDEPDFGEMTMNMSRLTADSTMSEDSLMLRRSTASSASMLSNRDSGTCGDLEGEIISSIKDNMPTASAIDMEGLGQFKYSVWVSFAEIYNENIYDLLEPLSNKKKVNRTRAVLQLRDDKNGTPYVRGLKDINVTTADEAYKLLTLGKKNLQIACTKLNRNSSRSHCIFTIKILQMVDTSNPSVARTSMLSFCDLAGSERYTKTQSFGERIKEAGNINTSLLTLGRCIHMLRHNQTNKDHPNVVPFRESKLTRMFQSFFCGKGKASMIVNINQCASTFDETLHALKYSAIAQQIIVVPEKPKPNQSAARQFSMLLNQNSRETIGWATPGTCAKVCQEESVLMDEEEETGSETEREKELIEMLEQMKEKLIQEKRKQLMLEVKIRDEVSQEMAQQLVEIESHYSERLKREQVYQEEKAERRMEILTQSVLKSRKRQRIFDDDENEEFVSSVLFHAEQTKVQHLEKQVQELQDCLASLRAETESLRDTAIQNGEERDLLQKENTAVKFKISDLEKRLSKVINARADESMTQSEMSDVVGKLADTESELEKQIESVTKLQQVIDILQCNAAEAEDRLLAAQKDDAKRKEKTTNLEEQLLERNATIQSLEKELEKSNAKCEEMKSQAEQQEEQLQVLQPSLEKLSQELEKLKSEEQDDIMISLKQEISERNVDLEKLQNLSQQKDEEIVDLRETSEAQSNAVKALEEQLSESKRLLQESEVKVSKLASATVDRDRLDLLVKELDSCQRQLDEAQQLVLKREDELEAFKTSQEGQGGLEEEIIRLREELRSTQAEITSKEEELRSTHSKCEEMVDERMALDSQLQTANDLNEELKGNHEKVNGELENVNKANRELTASLEVKEEQLFKAEEAQLELQEEMECVRNRLQELEQTLQHTEINHKQEVGVFETQLAEYKSCAESIVEKDGAVTSLTEEVNNLKNDLATKTKEAKKALEEAHEEKIEAEENLIRVQAELDILRSRQEDGKTQLEDYIVRVNEQVEVIADLRETLTSNQEDMDTLKQELQSQQSDGNETVKRLQDELKHHQDMLDTENENFEKRVADLEFQITELKQTLEKSKRDEASVQTINENLERKLSGLQVTIDVTEDEHDAERTRHEQEMTRTRAELQEKTNSCAELETELEHLRSLASGQEHDKTEAQAKMDELNRNVRVLKQKLDDAEYNHQMSCRQLRREKGSVEKLLKTAEETVSEQERKLKELSEQLEEMEKLQTEMQSQHKQEVDKCKTRSTKLEEVVKDLEICLKSSKDHEAKAVKESENLHQRCRRLETDCNTKEDTICSLNDEIERFRDESMMAANQSNVELVAQMDSLRREVMDYKKAIDDLEFEIKDMKEEKILVEREGENKTEEMSMKLEQLTEHQQDLKEQLQGACEQLTKTDDNLKTKSEELEETSSELAKVNSQLQDVTDKLRQAQNDLKNAHESAENLLSSNKSDMKEEIDSKNELIQNLKEELDQLKEHSVEMEDRVKCLDDLCEEKQVEIDSVQRERDSLSSELATVQESYSKLKNDALEMKSQNSSECKDLQSQLIAKANELAECQNMLDRREKKLEELRKQKQDLEIDLDLTASQLKAMKKDSNETSVALDKQLQIKCDELNESRNLVNKHVEKTVNLEDRCATLEEQLEELQEEKRMLKDELEAKSGDVHTFDLKFAKVEDKCMELERKVKELEESKQELETDVETKHRHLSGMTDLEKKLQQMEEERISSKSQVEELKSQIQHEMASNRELKESVSHLKSKLQEQTPKAEECIQLQSHVKVLEKKLGGLEAQVSESEPLTNKLHDVEMELEVSRKQKEKSDRLVRTLQEEVDDIETKLKDKMKKSSEAVLDLERQLEELHASMKKKQAAADTETESLQEEVMRLKMDLKRNSVSHEEVDLLQKKLQDLEAAGEQKYKSDIESLKNSNSENEEKLKEAECRCKSLREELEQKEKKLKSQKDSWTKFMAQMDSEKNSYDLVLKDARSNEMIIETLKKTLDEQEAAMQTQDEFLQNREAEVNDLGQEIDRHLQRIQELQTKEQEWRETQGKLREEKDVLERKLRLAENENDMTKHQAKKLEVDRDDDLTQLQRSKDRAEERLASTRQKLEDLERQLKDRRSQEGDLHEMTRELQEVERKLTAREEEVTSLRKQVKMLTLHDHEQKRKHDLESVSKDTHSLQMLKTKFQAKEDLVHQLEQEKLQWKTRAETIEEQKAQELDKWRTERDKLVGKIRQILEEKDSQINTLKQGDENQLISDLQRQVVDKDALIAQLSSHLDKSVGKTRRGRSSRTTATTGSSCSEDDTEGLRKEMENLHKQMDQMKTHHKHEINKIVKAKDTIINDMRHQNYTLSSHLSGEEIGQSYHVPTGTATVPSTLVPVTSDEGNADETNKARGKRGRPRKRKSSEHESQEDSVVVITTSKRSRKKSRPGRSVKLDENEDPSLGIISEEGMIDLDETSNRKHHAILNNSTNILDQTEDSERAPTFLSPKPSPAPAATPHRRKKKLKANVEEPLMESPVEMAPSLPVPSVPAQDIVKRKLRTRKK